MSGIDFERLKVAILKNDAILSTYLPDGRFEGNEYVCANIFGGKGNSFKMNTKMGFWSDFATGETGANLIDLVSKREGISFVKAAEQIAKYMGGTYDSEDIKTEIKTVKKKADVLLSKKIPFIPPNYIYRKGENVKINKLWIYQNENNHAVAIDARIDHEDGSKEIIPLRWNGEKWYQKAMPAPRKLYNLNKIAQDTKNKTIIVVEGCKTAEATEKYFPQYIVTTWQGGCAAVKMADWSPLYYRNVIIIPDADKQPNKSWDEQPGMKAANNIAKILAEHMATVRIVNTKKMSLLKSGWDIADAEVGNMPAEELLEFVKANIYDYENNVSGSETIDPEVIVKKNKYKVEYDDTYFTCLGGIGSDHYYYQKTSGQVIKLTPSRYKREYLLLLAPRVWWEANFPSKNGADWEGAVDSLCRIQEKIGVYDNSRIRGRGAWFDDGRPVLHLGSSLFVDGAVVDIDKFKSDYIYEKAPSLSVQLQTVLPKEDSARLIELCRLARWDKKYYGDILAGWIFSAMVCGALSFRSHLYLIGAKGSGKSWVLENIIKVIMGKIALSVSSKTTEPGIRQALGGDIRPVIFDEAEAENPTDKARMQAVFDLSRQASSEGADAIYKGGQNGGTGVSYLCRSSFLFASINNSMTKDADLSRTTVISLKTQPEHGSPIEKAEDNKAFKALERMASQLLTEEYCRCLFTRAIKMIPILRESHKIISNCAAIKFGSKRIGDQLGMILSGIWCLKNDTVIDDVNAENIIEFCAMREEKETLEEGMSQEERCLNHLFYSEVVFDREKYPLSMLVAYKSGKESIPAIAPEKLDIFLKNKGILVTSDSLILSRNERCLPAEIFDKTEWSGLGWKDSLLRIGGVSNKKAQRFCAGLVSGAIVIPLDYLLHQ